MTAEDPLLMALLKSPPLPAQEATEALPFTAWWRAQASERGRAPLDRALIMGARAPSLGFAFGAGYQAAIAALAPSLDDGELTALCVTEAKGGHPRAIEAKLTHRASGRGWLLSGEKTFVTLGEAATRWVIAASRGEGASGRNDIALVVVPAGTPGAAIEPRPPLPIIPEIRHAALRLDAVAVADDAVLEGDGYARYIKPFRTIEDIHVHAALLGHCLGLRRRVSWPQPLTERLLGAATALRSLAAASPRDLGGHLALAGVLSWIGASMEEAEAHLTATGAPRAAAWRRDRGVLSVASKARARRREVAWKQLDEVAREG